VLIDHSRTLTGAHKPVQVVDQYGARPWTGWSFTAAMTKALAWPLVVVGFIVGCSVTDPGTVALPANPEGRTAEASLDPKELESPP